MRRSTCWTLFGITLATSFLYIYIDQRSAIFTPWGHTHVRQLGSQLRCGTNKDGQRFLISLLAGDFPPSDIKEQITVTTKGIRNNSEGDLSRAL